LRFGLDRTILAWALPKKNFFLLGKQRDSYYLAMSGNYRFERIKAGYDLDMGSFWPRDKFWVIAENTSSAVFLVDSLCR